MWLNINLREECLESNIYGPFDHCCILYNIYIKLANLEKITYVIIVDIRRLLRKTFFLFFLNFCYHRVM